MKQAFSYIRFSSDRQAQGSSVERQQAMIRQWLDAHPDYALNNLKYSDLGKSGFHGDHIKEAGGFGKLLKAVKEGFIKEGDVVLVEAIDRAGRLPPFQMLTDVLAPILKAGVSIITLDDNTTYTRESADGMQIYMLIAKIQAAHSYSDALSRRISESFRIRREKAKTGITPSRMTPVWLNSDGTLRPDVVPWVVTAFELYVSGIGKFTIAKRLRDSGLELLAKCNGPTVGSWLSNPAVIGKWAVRIGTAEHEVIDDVYPPIIDPSLYYKAQLHAEKVKTIRTPKTTKHFLVGLVKCGCCGKNFIMQNKYGAPHSLRCLTRVQQNVCDNSFNVPKPVLDTIYRYTAVTAAMQAVSQQQMGVNEKEIVAREAELQELSRKVERLVDLSLEAGDMPEIVRRLQQAKAEREAAEDALVLLRKTVAPAAHGWVEQGATWKLERDDPQRLAAMLRGVGYSMTVQLDGRIVSSHSEVVYRYAGVDRHEDSYKLMVGDKLVLVSKSTDEYPYFEAFEQVEGEAVWDEADYENLRLQYE